MILIVRREKLNSKCVLFSFRILSMMGISCQVNRIFLTANFQRKIWAVIFSMIVQNNQTKKIDIFYQMNICFSLNKFVPHCASTVVEKSDHLRLILPKEVVEKWIRYHWIENDVYYHETAIINRTTIILRQLLMVNSTIMGIIL